MALGYSRICLSRYMVRQCIHLVSQKHHVFHKWHENSLFLTVHHNFDLYPSVFVYVRWFLSESNLHEYHLQYLTLDLDASYNFSARANA